MADIDAVRALAQQWAEMSYERPLEYMDAGRQVLSALDGTAWCYQGQWVRCIGHPAGTQGNPCVDEHVREMEAKRGLG